MLGEKLSPYENERLGELLHAERFQLKMLYRELPTPAIDALDGEYDAQLLDQGEKFASKLTHRIFSSRGPWVGKAFRPLNESSGEGYNAFGTPEDRRAELPMDTYIGHSLVGQGDSFILDYRAKNRGAIRWLRGEVRPVSDSVFLGMGTFGPWAPKLKKLRRVIPFVMVKSDRPYLLAEDDGPTILKFETGKGSQESGSSESDGAAVSRAA